MLGALSAFKFVFSVKLFTLRIFTSSKRRNHAEVIAALAQTILPGLSSDALSEILLAAVAAPALALQVDHFQTLSLLTFRPLLAAQRQGLLAQQPGLAAQRQGLPPGP